MITGIDVPGAIGRAGPADRIIEIGPHIIRIDIMNVWQIVSEPVFAMGRAALDCDGAHIILAAALLGDDVDDAGLHIAILGGETAAFNVDLLDRAESDTVDRLIVARIAHGDAIEHKEGLFAVAAADTQPPLHASLKSNHALHAADGQLLHLFTGHRNHTGRHIGLDDGALGDDRDFAALDLLLTHPEIGVRGLIDAHAHIAHRHFRIADQGDADIVDAGRNV